MNDEQLRRALRDLPRHRASDGFTRRTLARIDDAPRGALRPSRGRSARRLAAAAALVVAMAGVSALTWVQHRQSEQSEAATAAARAPATETGTSRPAGHRLAAHETSPERRAELREIRSERDRLAAELAELKRDLRADAPAGAGSAGSGSEARLQAPSGDPVLYLGGDDRIDLVLDLGRLAAERRQAVAVPGSSRGGSS